jgi:hypothetical protein
VEIDIDPVQSRVYCYCHGHPTHLRSFPRGDESAHEGRPGPLS